MQVTYTIYVSHTSLLPVLGHNFACVHIYMLQSVQYVQNSVCVWLQLYKLQSALRQAGVTMYGGERASHALSIERAKSDR